MASPPQTERTSSERSYEKNVEEEDALLTGQRTGKTAPTTTTTQLVKNKWREIVVFAWAVLATAAVVVLAVSWQYSNTETITSQMPTGKRNLIFMVSDGMGPTSLSLTRSWRQTTEQLPYDETLVLDQHLIGQSRTRSTSSLITDSAAGATAFSCGQKTYNGAISVLSDFSPCGSVMEAAKRMGYTTGLVVTTRITDATPAVFVSHARRREMEDAIALQMVGETHPLGRMVDLMFGGGRCHFLSNDTEGSCRGDETDVVKAADQGGWQYIDDKSSFDNLESTAQLPLMALFAPTDIPYEIDRQYQTDVYPSLEEMTTTALRLLSAATRDTEQGFFVMIEGSRIDHAGHANDPAAQVHEVLAFDKTMAAVLDFIKHEQTPTLMVSTSDHETGGLATAKQLYDAYPRYLWYPDVLANVSHSASHTAHSYRAHLSSQHQNIDASSEDLRAYLTALSASSLGIHDPTQAELDALLASPARASYMFADMVSRRAQTGWTTHGHSGADVNIYASNFKWAKALAGNRENTDVGDFLAAFLGASDEVERVTRELREFSSSSSSSSSAAAVGEEEGRGTGWLGRIPSEGERLDGQDHLERYHGQSKVRRCEVCGGV